MRRHLKKKTGVLIVLLLVGGLYLHNHKDFNINNINITVGQFWPTDRRLSQESWVDQGGYLPLNVSYELLAGAPPTQQRYLSVGISSVKRQKGDYLISTLQSIFSQSSPEERSSMVVVLLLADFNVSWRVAKVTEIKTSFSAELEEGQLLVLHVPEDSYPPLTGLKRNYNDAPDRVSFRSKQNLDYSFLMYYSSGLSQYYIQLEDDVFCAKNFLTTIKGRVTEQERKKVTWTMLEFSTLGYIGKLYKSSHLPLLARFLFLFYQEMPCDWLMSHFRVLLTQKEVIQFKPSLFQHMGTFSSFQGTHNNLKDKYFEEGLYPNPAAKVYSNIPTYQKYLPQQAWEAGEGYFWGRSPEQGHYLTVVFTDPTVVTWIYVATGSGGKDLLESAEVEIGRGVTTGDNEKSCKDFQSIGKFEDGMFEMRDVDKKYVFASSCLRILITASQKDWVIIQKIRIAVKPSSPQKQMKT